jgi:hypothetical protein
VLGFRGSLLGINPALSCVHGPAESIVCACVIAWVCACVVVMLCASSCAASVCVCAVDVNLFGEFMVSW